MIEIVVNDSSYQFESPLSIKDLINKLDFKDKLFVVALNEEFVSINDYGRTKVNDGDRVEILEPMSGG